MKITVLAMIAFLPVLSLQAQKTINDPNAEKRSISSFHGIEVGTGIDLQLTQGSTEEVAVSASSTEYRDRIVTVVENGILKIHYDSKLGSVNKRREPKNLRAYVSFKNIDLLNASTGAEVSWEGAIRAENLSLEVTTGALVNGSVDMGTLRVKQNTGSRITLTGKAGSLWVDGDTGSKFTGDELVAGTCNVSVSTGAKVSVRAEKEMEAKASTGGQVKYAGAAVIKSVKASSGGTISRI